MRFYGREEVLALTTFNLVMHYMPMVVAPIVLMIFGFVTAYVFKFGLPKTGINGDYLLLAFYVIVACIVGGAF